MTAAGTGVRPARPPRRASHGGGPRGRVSRAGQRAWGWFKRVAPWGLAALVLALVAGQARTRVAISGIKAAFQGRPIEEESRPPLPADEPFGFKML